jgi:hypothetical protein
MIRKLAYQDALVGQVMRHMMTFAPPYQPKLIMGINV